MHLKVFVKMARYHQFSWAFILVCQIWWRTAASRNCSLQDSARYRLVGFRFHFFFTNSTSTTGSRQNSRNQSHPKLSSQIRCSITKILFSFAASTPPKSSAFNVPPFMVLVPVHFTASQTIHFTTNCLQLYRSLILCVFSLPRFTHSAI